MAQVFRNNELERRIQERMFIRIAKVHETRLRRELIAQYRAAAKAVEAGRKPNIDDGRLTQTLVAMMTDSYNQFGRKITASIKEAQGRGGKRAVAMSPEFEEALATYIRMYAGKKVTEISDTTKARIALIVRNGIRDGMTNTEVAAAIRQAAQIDSAYRSAMIARTETHSAANAAGMESAAETGVVKEKEWISTEDERTRDGDNSDFDHTNVKNVPIDEPFIVSGEELMYPGDPSGSAGNIINCRCALGYVV